MHPTLGLFPHVVQSSVQGLQRSGRVLWLHGDGVLAIVEICRILGTPGTRSIKDISGPGTKTSLVCYGCTRLLCGINPSGRGAVEI